MNSEPDLIKAEREEKERQGLINDLLNEISLFNLKQDEDKDEDCADLTTSSETQDSHSLPTGIKFFYGCGMGSCSYTHESIRPTDLKINGLHFEEITNVSHLENFEFLLRCDKTATDSAAKKKLFEYFFKLLFTQQTECILDAVSYILIEIVNKTKYANYLQSTIIKSLPIGIQNLGGRVDVVYPHCSETKRETANREKKNERGFDPLTNINSILKVMKYVIVKETKLWKERMEISSADIDDLVFLLLVISQDPRVLYSSSLPSIQDLIALLLDLYPSDAIYSEKVQDMVESLGRYWDDSNDAFNHHLAYYVASNVLPLSRRGSHLRTSLAYYALMCCLLPNEAVDVHDFVLLPILSTFCHNNVDAIKNVDLSTFYSVVRLIDAAIDWPLTEDRDKKEVERILELIKMVFLSKGPEDDLFQKTKAGMLLNKVITSEWERHLKEPEKKLKQTTITNMFKKAKSLDDYSEPF